MTGKPWHKDFHVYICRVCGEEATSENLCGRCKSKIAYERKKKKSTS